MSFLASFIVSPLSVLMDTRRSSEPRANRLPALQAPQVIRFVCLPMIGICTGLTQTGQTPEGRVQWEVCYNGLAGSG